MLADKNLLKLAEQCGLNLEAITEVVHDAGKTGDLDSIYSELELTHTMQVRSSQDLVALDCMAAGSYHYFLPALVEIAAMQKHSNVEFLITEIESALSNLCELPYCRLYSNDVVTVLSNQLLSIQQDIARPLKVLLPATLSPDIRYALRTQLKYLSIDPEIIDFDKSTGCINMQQLEPFAVGEVDAIIVPWPNFFGLPEPLEQLVEWARSCGAKVIGLVNPLLLSYLNSPALLHHTGIDFLIGDCQSLGLPLNKGGNAPGFIATALPPAVLPQQSSLQAKDNDLRIVHAYISAMPFNAMRESIVMGRTTLKRLVDELGKIPEIAVRFTLPWVNECVIQVAQIDLEKGLKILSGHNMLVGYPLADDYPELDNCLLIHCDDRHTQQDIEKLSNKMTTVVKNLSTAGCPVKPKF